MSRQKIVIIFLSIIGIGGTFLPWIKGFLNITIDGFSSTRNDKDHLVFVLVCFLIPILICLLSKSEYLKRWMHFWAIVPTILASLFSVIYLIIDLSSPKIDTFLDIPGASEVGLVLGPAPYFVFITGMLIPIFGFALKQKVPTATNNKN